MARTETRSVQVAPQYEQSTIDIYERFGWTCVSAQTVSNKTGYLERDKNDENVINQVVESETYVKLMFNRDRDMDYYREIVDCERRYNELLKIQPREKIPFRRIFLYAGLFFVVIGGIPLVAFGATVGIGVLLLGVACLAIWFVRHKSAGDKFTAEMDAWKKKEDALFAEVSQYVY